MKMEYSHLVHNSAHARLHYALSDLICATVKLSLRDRNEIELKRGASGEKTHSLDCFYSHNENNGENKNDFKKALRKQLPLIFKAKHYTRITVVRTCVT
jgi:hypothetical protein